MTNSQEFMVSLEKQRSSIRVVKSANVQFIVVALTGVDPHGWPMNLGHYN